MSKSFNTYPVFPLPNTVTSHPGWEYARANLSEHLEEGKTFALSYDIFLSRNEVSLEPNLRAWRIENGKTCAYSLDLENPEMMAAHATEILELLSMKALFETVEDKVFRESWGGETYHLAVAKSGVITLSEDLLSSAYHTGRDSVLYAFADAPKTNHEKIDRIQKNKTLESVANALLRFQQRDQVLKDEHRLLLDHNTPK